MKKIYILSSVLLMLSSCAQSDYRVTKPISRESLTKYSSDKVSFSFQLKNFTKDLEDWIIKDAPDRADVSCDKDKIACEKAHFVLKKMGIPSSSKNQVELKHDVVIYYDSKSHVDCSKMIEGKSNFGCATSSNIKFMTSE